MALGTMWKNVSLGTALFAQADPVAYANANMDTLRSTFRVNLAIVSQTAKALARMQYYGAVAAAPLDDAKGGILKMHGEQMPDAKGIMGNNFGGNIWTFSAAFKHAAVIGLAGDILAGTAVDVKIEPYNADGSIGAGNLAPHTFLARVSAQEAVIEWGHVINGINNLEVLPVGNVLYIIPILGWRGIRVSAMEVVPFVAP